MHSRITAAVGAVVVCLSVGRPAAGAPTSFSVTFPLRLGGHHEPEPARIPTAAQVRTERRLRLARYGFQIADAIISAIGYHAYAKCLSCLAFPGGGPLGSAPLSVGYLNGNRPAESDPLVQPFSRGGIASLALGAVAYDLLDARIERHWSIERRETADVTEIAAHAWGISTWLPEIKVIHRDTQIAAACGAQWRAKQYGQAFSDGCVNEYYRPGPFPAQPLPAGNVIVVCAPPRFKPGSYLFATQTDYIVASGNPCTGASLPSP